MGKERSLLPAAGGRGVQASDGYRRFWEKNFQRLDKLLAEMNTRRGQAWVGGNAARVAGASAGARVTKKQKQHKQKGKR